jgi:hypothetical protein
MIFWKRYRGALDSLGTRIQAVIDRHDILAQIFVDKLQGASTKIERTTKNPHTLLFPAPVTPMTLFGYQKRQLTTDGITDTMIKSAWS